MQHPEERVKMQGCPSSTRVESAMPTLHIIVCSHRPHEARDAVQIPHWWVQPCVTNVVHKTLERCVSRFLPQRLEGWFYVLCRQKWERQDAPHKPGDRSTLVVGCAQTKLLYFAIHRLSPVEHAAMHLNCRKNSTKTLPDACMHK